MYKTSSIASSLLMLLICAAPAFADQQHLLLGTWNIDVSRLHIPSPPKAVAITLADVGGGQYRMTVDIVDQNGKKTHGDTTFKPDGTPAPAAGNADYDVVSMTMPTRGILVMGGQFKGHPANTRVFSLSDDGAQMIETVVMHDPDGTPHTRIDYWARGK